MVLLSHCAIKVAYCSAVPSFARKLHALSQLTEGSFHCCNWKVLRYSVLLSMGACLPRHLPRCLMQCCRRMRCLNAEPVCPVSNALGSVQPGFRPDFGDISIFNQWAPPLSLLSPPSFHYSLGGLSHDIGGQASGKQECCDPCSTAFAQGFVISGAGGHPCPRFTRIMFRGLQLA